MSVNASRSHKISAYNSITIPAATVRQSPLAEERKALKMRWCVVSNPGDTGWPVPSYHAVVVVVGTVLPGAVAAGEPVVAAEPVVAVERAVAAGPVVAAPALPAVVDAALVVAEPIAVAAPVAAVGPALLAVVDAALAAAEPIAVVDPVAAVGPALLAVVDAALVAAEPVVVDPVAAAALAAAEPAVADVAFVDALSPAQRRSAALFAAFPPAVAAVVATADVVSVVVWPVVDASVPVVRHPVALPAAFPQPAVVVIVLAAPAFVPPVVFESGSARLDLAALSLAGFSDLSADRLVVPERPVARSPSLHRAAILAKISALVLAELPGPAVLSHLALAHVVVTPAGQQRQSVHDLFS